VLQGRDALQEKYQNLIKQINQADAR